MASKSIYGFGNSLAGFIGRIGKWCYIYKL